MNASISFASEFTACAATAFTKLWNVSFLATKSVSELTSTTAAVVSSFTTTVQRPSAAILLAFFSALACPFFLKNSTASSMFPLVSFNAFLQSIIPAPVISRSSFTIAAVIAIFQSSKFIFYDIKGTLTCVPFVLSQMTNLMLPLLPHQLLQTLLLLQSSLHPDLPQ